MVLLIPFLQLTLKANAEKEKHLIDFISALAFQIYRTTEKVFFPVLRILGIDYN